MTDEGAREEHRAAAGMTPVPAQDQAPAGPGRTAGRAAGGHEPDARFTFANERTFLAWSRTSLALVVAGLAVVQLLPPFPGVPWGRRAIGTPLILLGAVVSAVSYLEWMASQRAMRLGEPIRRSRLPRLLAAAIAAIGLLAAAVVLAAGGRP